jgi:hypothetical protein
VIPTSSRAARSLAYPRFLLTRGHLFGLRRGGEEKEQKPASVPMMLVFVCAHLPSVLPLLRHSRFAAGNGLGIGLGKTISYVRIWL